MADFGAMFRADDGSLLVTSDTPTYEFVAEVNPSSRSGNVNTYSVSTSNFPLVFVKCGSGNSGSVLAIEGQSGSWTVTVLASVSCPIEVFVPLSGASTTGVGMVVYDANGGPVFDTNKKILNARNIGTLSEGGALASSVGTDMVAYTGGPVRPEKSESLAWVDVDTIVDITQQYICTSSLQYVCEIQPVYGCTTQYVCTPVFSCSFDPFSGAFSCGFVDSCSYVTVCGFTDQQVCSFKNVEVCGFQNVTTLVFISAQVRTTAWAIYRATARINADSSASFNWLLHQSGFYKEVIQYQTVGYSQTLTGAFLPPGYTPPALFFLSAEAYDGLLTKDNRYPYTTDRANTGALTCITGVRSDYD